MDQNPNPLVAFTGVEEDGRLTFTVINLPVMEIKGINSVPLTDMVRNINGEMIPVYSIFGT